MNKIFIIAVSINLLFLSSCKEEEKFALKFNHYLHVEDNELGCTDCHGEMTGGKFAKPEHDQCVDCHDEMINAEELSLKTCGYCHIAKDVESIGEAPEVGAVTVGVFRHSESLKDSCADCHGEMLAEGITQIKIKTRSDVVSIRNKAHASGKDCITCHESMAKDVKPLNHNVNWTRRHGNYANQEDAVCIVCHEQKSCNECHQSQMPSSHNSLWRLKTHGVEAEWNRESCQTCHKTDFCIGCHQDTQPLSHKANWSRRHCLACHTSESTEQGCTVCHTGGIKNESHQERWDDPRLRFHNSLPSGFNCLNKSCHPIR